MIARKPDGELLREVLNESELEVGFGAGLIVGIRVFRVEGDAGRSGNFGADPGIDPRCCCRRIERPAIESDVGWVAFLPEANRDVDRLADIPMEIA